ncbi:MAG: tetraacyldisaccharide 4'-kinase [Bacteroidales bacterium]
MSIIRVLLFPFSALYWCITLIRNKLFDTHILPQTSCAKTVIAIGNITVGGTGKTPHVHYIVSALHKKHNCAILSRGYKRATKGYIDTLQCPSPSALGDESYMYHQKFPDIAVAVCENRVYGAQQILRQFPDTDVIVLDDAYQHRHIKPHLTILLIDYTRPLTSDSVFPAGRMREGAYARKRADVIIVSKCPQTISDTEKNHLSTSLQVHPNQYILFSHISYGTPYHIKNNTEITIAELISHNNNILLLTGIAQATPMKTYIQSFTQKDITHCEYPDHHNYSSTDIQSISNQAHELNAIIITTEKDMYKLLEHTITHYTDAVYVLPISVSFSPTDHNILMKSIHDAIKNT